MRWFVEQRQRFIDAHLRERGFINRRDLQTTFGISQAQASVDLRRFKKAHPRRLRYNVRMKRYELGRRGREQGEAEKANTRSADFYCEMIIARWYARGQEWPDMLPREGLDELERAIKEVLVEEGLAAPQPSERDHKEGT